MTKETKSGPSQLTIFFHKLDRILLKMEEDIMAYGIIFLAIVIVGGVLSRTVFNQTLVWTEEVSKAAVVIITFLGLGYCTRKARHIRMSAFHDLLPPLARKALIIFVSAVTAVLLLFMAYWACQYVGKVKDSGSVSSTLRFPMYLVYMWVPLGFIMCALEYILTVFKNLSSEGVYLSVEVMDGYESEGFVAPIQESAADTGTPATETTAKQEK